MRTPFEAIRTLLLGRAEITAIVGQRIYLMQIPQSGEMPLLLISGVSGSRRHDLGMGGVGAQRISVECRSTKVDDATGANRLGEYVFAALDGRSNIMGPPAIELITYASEAHLYEDTSKAVRRIIDFHCHLAS